jgi:hypothetical protein
MIDHMLGCLSLAIRTSAVLLSRLRYSILCRHSGQPAGRTTAEHAIVAESFVEKLWFWQTRLTLREWNVSVIFARKSDLKPKTLGNIHWDNDKKTAIIRVLDPADYRMPFQDMLQDMEFTVVHELIHLEFAPALSQFSRSDASRRDEEHAVNHVAAALIKLQHDQSGQRQ